MIFSSYVFLLIFLPVVLMVFYLVRTGPSFLGVIWLILASLFFYAYWNVHYLWLVLASILLNYLLSIWVSQGGPRGRVALWAGIIGNLVLLGYYKYANFFMKNAHHLLGLEHRTFHVILPLAISFFTFQQIAYLVDLHHSQIKRPVFWHYMLCILFFPHLIAGPIVRVREFLPQFMRLSKKPISSEQLGLGVSLLFVGLFKKVILADPLGRLADLYFTQAQGGIKLDWVTAWVGALAYTFQIYLDFSAYSEMAVGIALLFGIVLPQNFQFPYHSTTIIEFWRRWHITLSRFLRDYLYIPLGGNRQGYFRRNLNLFITMLLGGLWHGAGWNFVAWGGLHGLYLTIGHGLDSFTRIRLPSFVGWLLTFLAVVVSWVLFKATSFQEALYYWQRMTAIRQFKTLWKHNGEFAGGWLILIVAALWILLEPRLTRYRNNWAFAMLVSLLGLLALFSLGEEQKFIYFNF